MAMLNISGAAIKEPSTFEVSYFDTVDSKTNLAGTTNVDIIRLNQCKIQFGYNLLTKAELKTIVDLLKPTTASYFKTVIYLDNIANTNTTITCQVSERTMSMYINLTSKTLYRDISFELIER